MISLLAAIGDISQIGHSCEMLTFCGMHLGAGKIVEICFLAICEILDLFWWELYLMHFLTKYLEQKKLTI